MHLTLSAYSQVRVMMTDMPLILEGSISGQGKCAMTKTPHLLSCISSLSPTSHVAFSNLLLRPHPLKHL